MHNRVEIAREFAKAIKSDYIIKIILFGSVLVVMIRNIRY